VRDYEAAERARGTWKESLWLERTKKGHEAKVAEEQEQERGVDETWRVVEDECWESVESVECEEEKVRPLGSQ
jgi:hypothetical protein